MRKAFFALAFLCLHLSTQANNLSVSNVGTTGQDMANDFTLVEFDLSWDNSWRLGAINRDAAWVFVKFQVGVKDPELSNASSSGTTVTVGSTANLRVGMPVVVTAGTGTLAANTVISSITNATQFELSAAPSVALSNATIVCRRIWEHATLNTTAGNHTAPAGSTIEVPSDGVGVFLYRSADGDGTFSVSDVQLRWEYGSNGVADDAVLQIQVFAIEMAYVPQGSFAAGSGGAENSAFTLTTINTATATTAPSGTGSLGGQAGGYPTGQTAPNVNWPNGYNAFYCMKYEVSQGQYRDFLNTLTYAQQVSRTINAPSSAAGTAALSNANRNGLDIQTPGVAATAVPAVYGCNLDGDGNFNESNDGEWIACNFLSWMDGCAFVQWSGLRPMTELEFEKACRGDQLPVANEYAWGTTAIAAAAYTLSNAGAADEGIATNYSTTDGNASYITTDGSLDGPLRGGIFSANGSNSGRISAGASYYGIMEMSGNLWERTVSIGNADGRAFTGLHGNGSLSTAGHATTSAWPGLISGELTGATGGGFRGGVWLSNATLIRVSDRTNAANTDTARNYARGFRGIRLAP